MNEHTGPRRAAIYCRVSTKSQEDNFSLRSQEANCRDYAHRQGYEVVAVYREVFSGFSLNRPQFSQLRDAMRRGEIDVVIVNAFDRWASDDQDNYSLYVDLEAGNVALESVTQGRFENSPLGRHIMGVYSLGRQLWLTDHIERTMRGLCTKAKGGMVIGSNRAPFGYRFVRHERANTKPQTVGLEESPAEAEIVRRIFRAAVSRSTLEIATDLNAEGEPSPTGRAWRQSTINKILRNSTYAGTWTFMDISVAVPPLVSQREQEAALTAMAERDTGVIRRGRAPRSDDPYVLRGRLRCGHCGGVLKTDTNNGRRYYMCGICKPSGAARRGLPVCDLPAVNAVDIERALAQTLTATVMNPDVLVAGLNASAKARDEADASRDARRAVIDHHLKDHRRTLSRQLDELVEVGPEARKALRAKIAETERQIAQCERERVRLDVPPPGLISAASAEAIVTYVDELRAGFAALGPAETHRLSELLQIRGTVRLAAPRERKQVVPLGRSHKYVIDWKAALPVSITSPDACPSWMVLDTVDGLRLEVAA